jgi:hypothetical protein
MRDCKSRRKELGVDGDVLLPTSRCPWWRMIGGLCAKGKLDHQLVDDQRLTEKNESLVKPAVVAAAP